MQQSSLRECELPVTEAYAAVRPPCHRRSVSGSGARAEGAEAGVEAAVSGLKTGVSVFNSLPPLGAA